MGCEDGCRKPLDEDDLVVCNEEEVEELDEDPMVVLADVGPSIILASSFESSLPSKIEGMFHSPESNCGQHDDLPGGKRNIPAVALMIEVVCSIANGKKGPYPINPRVLSC